MDFENFLNEMHSGPQMVQLKVVYLMAFKSWPEKKKVGDIVQQSMQACHTDVEGSLKTRLQCRMFVYKHNVHGEGDGFIIAIVDILFSFFEISSFWL
eukprot:TRINITY_DN1014_c0_g1_i1.p2 TRINITY_DN1014_c0_g1~~TRINITY_DN1014_c0_g1_i1.p2  ORF type:complete len:97 (-),score=13.90 TRINITY_DN1014_c0_g1_i1:412-702(-)